MKILNHFAEQLFELYGVYKADAQALGRKTKCVKASYSDTK